MDALSDDFKIGFCFEFCFIKHFYSVYCSFSCKCVCIHSYSVCLCMCVYSRGMGMDLSASRNEKRVLDSLNFSDKLLLSTLWVLRTEPVSSEESMVILPNI